MREDLEIVNKKFMDEEVLTLKEMGPTKVPGPNAFHALFYQKFWGKKGPSIMKVCLMNGSW